MILKLNFLCSGSECIIYPYELCESMDSEMTLHVNCMVCLLFLQSVAWRIARHVRKYLPSVPNAMWTMYLT